MDITGCERIPIINGGSVITGYDIQIERRAKKTATIGKQIARHDVDLGILGVALVHDSLLPGTIY